MHVQVRVRVEDTGRIDWVRLVWLSPMLHSA